MKILVSGEQTIEPFSGYVSASHCTAEMQEEMEIQEKNVKSHTMPFLSLSLLFALVNVHYFHSNLNLGWKQFTEPRSHIFKARQVTAERIRTPLPLTSTEAMIHPTRAGD